MKSTNRIYQTEAGKNLLNTLHADYWDTLAGITDMIEAMQCVLPEAKTPEDRAAIERRIAQLHTAHESIRGLAGLVTDKTI